MDVRHALRGLASGLAVVVCFAAEAPARDLAQKIRIDDKCYSRCHREGGPVPALKKQFDGCWWKAEFLQSRVALYRNDVIIVVVGVRSPAVRRRHEPFSDQITNLPFGDTGAAC